MLVGTQYKDDIPQILTEAGLLHDADFITTDINMLVVPRGVLEHFSKCKMGVKTNALFAL